MPESTMLIGRRIPLHNWKGLLRIKWAFKTKKLAVGMTYVVAHNSYHGYYHWLLESLPRLLEAQRSLSGFTLLLPDFYTAEFYRDTLKLLGIHEVVRLEAGTMYKVPTLALAYSEITMGSYDSTTLHCLRTALLAAWQSALQERLPRPSYQRASLPGSWQPVVQEQPSKLYVSRKRAARRKVLNEDEVEQALATHGFEIVCFEDYTFEQQLRLCATAEVLISIHGAGLANMLFQPGGARVIELRKFDNGENIFFSELATALGLRYQLLYCQTQNERELVQDADLWVDTAALLALLA